MATFFTSDTHFGHRRIIELCNRPFSDVTEMNEMMVSNWNRVVSPEDTVYHLGDVALGPIEESLGYIKRLNGEKILVVGNHDRPFPPMQRGRMHKVEEWTQRYMDAGFDEVYSNAGLALNGYEFRLSHFPYDGDHTNEERYSEYRQPDNGVPLIHGHTHLNSRFSRSKNGTAQVHVGQDAWGFFPVSLGQVVAVLEGSE